MSRKCSITEKAVLSGNLVSHSNIKTKRKFKPNLQPISLMSSALNKKITMRITPSTLRTIEHNGGLDPYLIKTSNTKLSASALMLKKRIQQAVKDKKLALAAETNN